MARQAMIYAAPAQLYGMRTGSEKPAADHERVSS